MKGSNLAAASALLLVLPLAADCACRASFALTFHQVAASCLYIICRQEKKPFMLIDYSDLLQVCRCGCASALGAWGGGGEHQTCRK